MLNVNPKSSQANVNEPQNVFEDDTLFIINKPSGWVVNDALTVKNTPTVQAWLSKKNFSIAKSREYRSGIVHRLDKETSGVLIVAKTPECFSNLQSQFKARKVQKTYLALVHGELKPDQGRVEVPLGRLPWNRRRFGVLPGGKPSLTKYKVIQTYQKKGQTLSLVEAYPKTGRTHQIRIHMKYLHSPIVADEFYAGRKTARGDRLWCPRLFLHAKKITFRHPELNKIVEFEASLPSDLQIVLNKLG